MQLIIVTGLSGGGKSIAIRQLEDSGFYCIDNLPAEFLLPIAENLEKNGTRAAAVAIDARSHATFENAFTALEALSQRGIDVRILFLTASNEELLRRFSETRRRHPLSTLAEHHGRELTLNEAIAREREIMAPVTETAHVLDTTRLLPSQLRRWVQQFVKQPAAKLTLTFESFGYKRGLPYASDLVFDVRCLPNPYYSPELRPLTGLDAPVASYLAQEPLVSEMIDDIAAFIAKWLPTIADKIATTSPSALAVRGDSTDRYMLQKCLDADLPIKPAQLSVIERFQPICSRKTSFRHYKRLGPSIRAKRFLHTPVPASVAQAMHRASRRRA